MFPPSFSEILFYLVVNTNSAYVSPLAEKTVVASRAISLENRYPAPSVNEVFRDNILLNLAYMKKEVSNPSEIKWGDVRKPFRYEFVLDTGKAFAFQEDVYPKYKNTIVKTTNAHFNLQEGFKSDGYLAGDGVCHLASLIYWVAKDANLEAEAPVNHDFMPIPDIPREYGVSIYSSPGQVDANARQNLYITNNTQSEIFFVFDYDGETLTISILTKAGNKGLAL